MSKRIFYPVLRVIRGGNQLEPSPADREERDLSDSDLLSRAKTLARCSMSEARTLLDESFANKFCVLPLGLFTVFGREVLSAAAAEPDDEDLKAGLRFATGKEVKLIAVDREVITRAIFIAYHGDDRELSAAVDSVRARKDGPAVGDRLNLDLRECAGEAGRFLARLVDYAIAHDASDIHLSPRINGMFAAVRINGRLLSTDTPLCGLEVHREVIGRIKVLARLDTTIRGQPQDGSFRVPVDTRAVQLRVSTMPTVHGEKVVLRIMGNEARRSLASLGIPERVLEWIKEVIAVQQGYILFSGPTGSGKSTTLYSLLGEFEGRGSNLVTLEDPVELEISGASQTSICEATGLTFSAGLRAALRQDPDVIMLGEIRDAESARIAFQAALTGHLLLSSVHARNVWEVFTRLEGLGVERELIAQPGSLVISQRLIPELCARCKVLDLKASNDSSAEVYQAVGCAQCDYAGYSGRVLAIEALRIDSGLSQLILERDVPTTKLHSGAPDAQLYPLRMSLATLLEQGRIDCGQLDRYGA